MLTCALKTYVRPNQCGDMLGGVSHYHILWEDVFDMKIISEKNISYYCR